MRMGERNQTKEPQMSVSDWSENIIVANLQDEPALSDDLAGLIERTREANNPPSIVLNLESVTYLNSSNLAQLLDLRKALVDHNAGLRLCELQHPVASLFTVTGLDRVFEIQDNTAIALASMHIEDDHLSEYES